MRPISPNTGAPERVYAEEQAEYLPLSVAEYLVPKLDAAGVPVTRADGTPLYTSRTRVTAWVPSREELERLAAAFAQTIPGTAVAGQAQLAAALREVFTACPVYLALVDFGQPLTPHMVSLGPEPWMILSAE